MLCGIVALMKQQRLLKQEKATLIEQVSSITIVIIENCCPTLLKENWTLKSSLHYLKEHLK